MTRCMRLIAVVALVTAGTSCASSGGGSARPHVKPPELLTTSHPDLVAPGVTPNAPRPSRLVDLQVLVKPDGTPDMNTLKIVGPAAEANRVALTAWVTGLRFKPALQDGQPVSGIYQTSFGAMTRTTRSR